MKSVLKGVLNRVISVLPCVVVFVCLWLLWTWAGFEWVVIVSLFLILCNLSLFDRPLGWIRAKLNLDEASS